MWNEDTEMVGWMKVRLKDNSFFFPSFRGDSNEVVSKIMKKWAVKNEATVLESTITKFGLK